MQLLAPAPVWLQPAARFASGLVVTHFSLLALWHVLDTWRWPGARRVAATSALLALQYGLLPPLLYGRQPQQPASFLLACVTASCAFSGIQLAAYWPLGEPPPRYKPGSLPGQLSRSLGLFLEIVHHQAGGVWLSHRHHQRARQPQRRAPAGGSHGLHLRQHGGGAHLGHASKQQEHGSPGSIAAAPAGPRNRLQQRPASAEPAAAQPAGGAPGSVHAKHLAAGSEQALAPPWLAAGTPVWRHGVCFLAALATYDWVFVGLKCFSGVASITSLAALPYLHACAAAFGCGMLLMFSFECLYPLIRLCMRLAGSPRVDALPPTIFYRPWAAPNLSQFWSRHWHQLMRLYFVDLGQLLLTGALLPALAAAGVCPKRRAALEPALKTASAFVVSGLLHEYINWLCFGIADGRQLLFFGLHAAAVLAEQAVSRSAPRLAAAVPGWLARAATYGFIFATAPLFSGPYFEGGYFRTLLHPLLYSPSAALVRALGWAQCEPAVFVLAS